MKTIATAFLWMALLVSARAQNRYRVTDLGVLPGGTYSFARAINDRGQVVGESQVTENPNIDGGLASHAFLYSNGRMQDLGVLGNVDSLFSFATAINNHGQVVGSSTTQYTDFDFVDPFLWSAGHMNDLGTLGGVENGAASAINDRGVIVGSSPIKTGELHAFIYNGVLHDLGAGDDSEATSINNFDQVVGNAFESSTNTTRSFLWHHGKIRFLPTLGGKSNYAAAINDWGVIVGLSSLAGDLNSHAYVYADGKIYDLSPDPASFSDAYGLNRLGRVVGSCNGHAVLWQIRGKMRDLNEMIDPGSGWTLTEATGINDLGQITGNGTHNGLSRAFLLNVSY
jgi:probable HAF family extracellular repeat protein